ncbi:MAG TPA: hypothetical protein VHZ03_11185 [Trebonia sp.]|nr:hypothetical protein [Trebonia sp.]
MTHSRLKPINATWCAPATATATTGRRRSVTLKTDSRAGSSAEPASTMGTSSASATPTGQRRRNQSRAEASTPMPASTPKTTAGAPGIQPFPCVPALVISRSMPPVRDNATKARSVIRSSWALGVLSATAFQRRREPAARISPARLPPPRRK